MEPESAAPEPSLPDLAAHRWPSAADWNPIGRSPRPSQTPATYFKRPYRNCPDRRSCHRQASSRRDSPDRDLTFAGTDSEATDAYWAHSPVGVTVLSRSVPAKVSQFGEVLWIKVSSVARRLQRRRERLYRSTAYACSF